MEQIERMAEIALIICKVNMSQEERNNAKGFSDCHDCFDANLALYGAYCGEFFAEPDFTLDETMDILNGVSFKLDSMIGEGKLK